MVSPEGMCPVMDLAQDQGIIELDAEPARP